MIICVFSIYRLKTVNNVYKLNPGGLFMNNKILVILTGGTIGSVCSDGVRGINGDSPYILLREFSRRCPEYSSCRFDVINPYSILSENLTYLCWEKLYTALSEAENKDYRGIIVTHGSDTLAYTAAVMGYLMRHTSSPIVFTAADRPVNDPRSNAIPNFRSAVEFILNGGLRGVFVSYKIGRVNAINLAARLCSADCCLDEFTVYGGEIFGEIKEGEFLPRPARFNPSPDELNRPFSPIASGEISLTRKVMLLHSYPHMDYSAINPEGFAAVINCGYHCATACTEGGSLSLLKFAEICGKCGTDLWLGSFKSRENEIYSSNNALLKCGIKQFNDISWEAAYAKAVLAYNLPGINAEKFMSRGIYFEKVGAINHEGDELH